MALMDNYILPATRYEPPVARKAPEEIFLNTIIEDDAQETIREIRRACTKAAKNVGVASLSLHINVASGQPRFDQVKDKARPLLTGRPDSTGFRHDCQTLESHDPNNAIDDRQIQRNRRVDVCSDSVYSESTERTSGGSIGRSHRNRYPSLIIPSPSMWPNIHKLGKSLFKSSASPTAAPTPQISVSPAILSLLDRAVPAANALPSLDGSLTSERMASCSAPVTPNTPDTQTEAVGDVWSQNLELVNRSTAMKSPAMPEVVLSTHKHGRSHSEITRPTSHCSPVEQGRTDAQVINTLNVPGPGVLLSPAALDTLQRLTMSGDPDPPSSRSRQSTSRPFDTHEMQELSCTRKRRASVGDATPASLASLTPSCDFAQISIPSPSAFFSSLSKNARHTWSFPTPEVEREPLSSATAERFYSAPWNCPDSLERVVEKVPEETELLPTVRQATLVNGSSGPLVRNNKTGNARKTVLRCEYEDDYDKEIREMGSANLDRTGYWLQSQERYLHSLSTIKEQHDTAPGMSVKEDNIDSQVSPMRKVVRFIEDQAAAAAAIEEEMSSSEATVTKEEPLVLQGFQHIANNSQASDPFMHAKARYEAIQTSRGALSESHIKQLSGIFELSYPDRPPILRPTSLTPDTFSTPELDFSVEKEVLDRVERERQILEQICVSMWAVQALKYCHQDRLLVSPAAEQLARLAETPGKAPRSASSSFRILDLGGQAACDWGWFCANAYPHANVFTVISTSQYSNPDLKSPSNYRYLSVQHFWDLPFPDAYFEVISTRSLHRFLHTSVQGLDEYNLCLREVFRVLKPGGYFEFFVQDAEMMHAGPLGSATSVEFAFNLRSCGYDPCPTKSWLSRLSKAGFPNESIRRMWLFLPTGAPVQTPPVPETPSTGTISEDVEVKDAEDTEDTKNEVTAPPVLHGTTNAAAPVVGLVGGWMWEQWMLKLNMEMGKGDTGLAEGTGRVLEEGRNCGAGWSCLSGWTQKPKDGFAGK